MQFVHASGDVWFGPASEYLPGAHALHVMTRLGSSPNFPGGQTRQAPFALGAYFPLGHPHRPNVEEQCMPFVVASQDVAVEASLALLQIQASEFRFNPPSVTVQTGPLAQTLADCRAEAWARCLDGC